jgi:excinuclease ABC subunit C
MRTDPSHLPAECGVYLFKASDGTVLYVGKAVDIRSRIRSHLHDRNNPKEDKLRRSSETIDWILTKTELEALVLEDTLIKRHHPHYNVRLKDDKSYPYITLSREDFPTVRQVRGIHTEQGDHFGPHGDPVAVRRSLRWLRKMFQVRSCLRDMSKRSRPCLEYHIGRCCAPCNGSVDREAYSVHVKGLREVLSGRGEVLLQELRGQMWNASSEESYERAALLRDVVKGLERMLESQRVVLTREAEMDVISFSEDRTAASVLIVRGGRFIDAVKFGLESTETLSGPYEGFLSSYYAISGGVPSRIVLDPFGMGDVAKEELERFLSAKRGGEVRIRKARGGDERALVDISRRNAEEKARTRVRELESIDVLASLKDALSLPTVPLTIECFDVSHLSGTGTVASMVQFREGKPRRSSYRRFRISSDRNDDFSSMKEAVSRRYTRLRDEKGDLPDLILIDGGKGQLGAALEALAEAGIDPRPQVAALAKKEESIHLPGREIPLSLKRDDPALRLLQRVRDESHRFAVTYQRRTRKLDESILFEVKGIGKARHLRLSAAFDSLASLVEAGPETVSERAGIPHDLAVRLVDHVRSYLYTRNGQHESSVSKP